MITPSTDNSNRYMRTPSPSNLHSSTCTSAYLHDELMMMAKKSTITFLPRPPSPVINSLDPVTSIPNKTNDVCIKYESAYRLVDYIRQLEHMEATIKEKEISMSNLTSQLKTELGYLRSENLRLCTKNNQLQDSITTMELALNHHQHRNNKINQKKMEDDRIKELKSDNESMHMILNNYQRMFIILKKDYPEISERIFLNSPSSTTSSVIIPEIVSTNNTDPCREKKLEDLLDSIKLDEDDDEDEMEL